MAKFNVNIPSDITAVKIQNFINGQWVPPTTNNYMDTCNPATGQKVNVVPCSGQKDVDDAVKAAKAAFPMWAATPANERAAILNRVADLIDQYTPELAKIESQDQGKTVHDATKIDMPLCAEYFRQFAGMVQQGFKESESQMSAPCTPMSILKPQSKPLKSVTQHVPSGVAALITPWNFPMLMICEKLAPCIAVGNTCVVKPTELTSCTPYLLTLLLQAAGLPNGVVNFVFGTGVDAGEPLVKHPDVRLVSFTGGSLTGSKIGAAAGGLFKRVNLELGGKNPSVVFSDCDMEHAVATNVRAAFQNQGEICLCSSRQYVQRDVYDKFLQMFREQTTREVRVGDPNSKETFYGPMISKQHMEKVLSYIRLAQEEGAKVEFLVSPNDKNVKSVSKDGRLTIAGLENGYYVAPTLITNIKQSSRVMQEEIFGPVVCVLPFNTEEEAVMLANDTRYGLGASVWTQDQGKLMRVMKQVHSGMVWGNSWMSWDDYMPFGGMKCSGTGREHGPWSLDFYTEIKALYTCPSTR
ncbi:hypothetical protein GGI07_003407 [Coemansia sp. Benny D115]|nr:hypothetical protein GGI07_003407 [Coemansia sp. Benny D115]